ncbi:MAG: hypothetical protein H0W15_01905 [Gemmatimonadales bacterium]|nr:hypothetical protein [Gemmatimonadales bacterium]
MATLGCLIVATDYYTSQVRVRRGDGIWTVIGSRGAGPGELAQPRSLSIASDSTISVIDVGRQRLIRYELTTGGRSEDVLWPNGVRLHRVVGTMVHLSPDTLLDFWMAGEWGGDSRAYSDMADARVVDVVDLRSRSVVARFGDPILPPDHDDYVLMTRLQAGDIAVHGHRVFLLRAPTGQVEVFEWAAQLVKVDSFQLPRYRDIRPWSESGTTWRPGSITANTKRFTLHDVATAITIMDDGTIVAVVVGPKDSDSIAAYPNQFLVHLSRTGARIKSWALPVNGVSDVQALSDGRVVLLGHEAGDLDGGAGLHLLISEPITRASSSTSCRP